MLETLTPSYEGDRLSSQDQYVIVALFCSFQGLYDNFLNMKLKDSSFSAVCLALEWLGFCDIVSSTVMHGQNFQLMRYLPFLPVAFHLLFAASSIPRLAYPNSQYEASTED